MSENPETKTEEPKTDYSKIASEMLGDEFKGEVAELPDKPEELTDEVTEEIIEPDGDEVEEVEATEDTEQETDDPEEGEVEEKVETPAEPMFTVKIDGVESEVPQSEVIKSFQIKQASEKNLEEAKARGAEIIGDAEARDKTLNEQMGVAAIIINSKFEALKVEEAKVDWDSLEKDDPATFAAKKIKFQDRQNAIRGEIETARITFAKAGEKMVEDNKKNLDTVIRSEHIKLMELVPAWKDQKVADKESKEVAEYFLKKGIPADEIENLNKALGWSIGRDAMKWDKQQSKSNPAAKKITAVPKTIKPGAAKQAGAGAKKQLLAAQARAIESGDFEDAVKVYELQRKIA